MDDPDIQHEVQDKSGHEDGYAAEPSHSISARQKKKVKDGKGQVEVY